MATTGRLDILLSGLIKEGLKGLDGRLQMPGVEEFASPLVDGMVQHAFKQTALSSLKSIDPMWVKGLEVLAGGLMQRQEQARMKHYMALQQAQKEQGHE